MDSPHNTNGREKQFVGPTFERPLRRLNRTRDDNIKADYKEIRSECVNSINLSQDRVHLRAYVQLVMKLQIP
jgi:hypothetical protein